MFRFFRAALLGCLIGTLCAYLSFKENLACLARAYLAVNSQLMETYRVKKDNWYTLSEMQDFLDRYHHSKELDQRGMLLAKQLLLKDLVEWGLIGSIVCPMMVYALRPKVIFRA